ncbi:MAG: hypothetical protein R3D55_07965 [Chloroflexota bacterium]
MAGYTSFGSGELARKLHQPTTDQILAEQWQAETAGAPAAGAPTNITIGGAPRAPPADNSKRLHPAAEDC